MTCFDIVVVAINMLALKEIEIGLYSAIAIYIISKVIEIIAEGVNFTKMIFIVSDKYEEISREISEQLGRGSTAISATGMYENQNRTILWCVASKNEITKIRQIAYKIDKSSFMSIFNAREVYGMGFKKI
ncbi:MAG: YitT family protein [Clostridia bacterium]|nr:YitT family protein [Clostridia bacterium]